MRTIIFVLLALGLFFGICVFAGIKFALAAFSLLLAVLATVFILKKDSYMRFYEFANPKYILQYKSKDTNFRKRYKTTHIIVLYIISAIMLFMSVVIPNTTIPVQSNNFIYIIAAVFLSILLLGIDQFILKKSRKNSSYWFYFIASIMSVLIVLTLVLI